MLLLEPYYGGSHKAFLAGLRRYIDCRFTLLSLPARKWKMRMQLAAPWFAEQIVALFDQGASFDSILTSTFLDVAVLRSLLFSRDIQLPLALYFHENQFSYPAQINDPGIFQFTSINFTSALCADRLAFNSRYNLETFLSGIRSYLKKTVDMELRHLESEIYEKSIVLYPGVDFQQIDAVEDTATESNSSVGNATTWKNKTPVIVWNHRWEHDKAPETFFHALFDLAGQHDFKVIVLGQHFRYQPEIFSRARKTLADQLLHCGYAESKEEYARLLKQGDIIVSTAKHEFFGIAVLEGIRAGCRPLVPDRLSYRELFARQYRYPENNFSQYLRQLLVHPRPLSATEARHMTRPYTWKSLAEQYRKWLLYSNTEPTG
ncbi:MAG: DUF3524 domain-containing protein [Candidatus Electrothrix sp. AR4]|nr:DUF3524 domain-containing protein [Candidatus Electrothrix sp. AR4]